MFNNINQFLPSNSIGIIDKHDPDFVVTEQMFASIAVTDEDSLLLEPVTFEDVEMPLIGNFSTLQNSMMLAAISSKFSTANLKRTVGAFEKKLNQSLNGTGLETTGFKVGKPRKTGEFATLVGQITLSDGQAISMLFHAPDEDPAVFKPDDILYVFQFKLNARDVTNVVAPTGGINISLSQATMVLSNLAEKNSNKFVEKLSKNKQAKADLDAANIELETTQEQASALAQEVDQLSASTASLTGKFDTRLGMKAKQDLEIKSLNEQIASLPEPDPEQELDFEEVNNAPENAKAEFDKKANEAATSDTNDLDKPTQAQQEAGNYKKGKAKFQGIDVVIENPKGSTRSGTSPDGSTWKTTMKSHYGDIVGTKGADDDKLDIFIGENHEAENAYIVDQVNQDGSFDEHKIMLGFDDKAKATKGYMVNYEAGWQGLGNITEISMEKLKTWIKGSTVKPYKAISGSSTGAEKASIKEGIRFDDVTTSQGQLDTWDSLKKGDRVYNHLGQSVGIVVRKPTVRQDDLTVTDGNERTVKVDSRTVTGTSIKRLRKLNEKGRVANETHLAQEKESKSKVLSEGDVFFENGNEFEITNIDLDEQKAEVTQGGYMTFVTDVKDLEPRYGIKVKGLNAGGDNEESQVSEENNAIDFSKMNGLSKEQKIEAFENLKTGDLVVNSKGENVGHVVKLLNKAMVTLKDGDVDYNDSIYSVVGSDISPSDLEEPKTEETDNNNYPQSVKEKLEMAKSQGGANHWYGLKMRPYSIGAQPKGISAYLDNDEEGGKVSEVKSVFTNISDERSIRHGALAYSEELSQEQINSFELVKLDINDKSEIFEGEVPDREELLENVIYLLKSEAEDKKLSLNEYLDFHAQADATPKSLLGKQLKYFPEYVERKENVPAYKALMDFLNSVTWNELKSDESVKDETPVKEQSESSKLFDKLKGLDKSLASSIVSSLSTIKGIDEKVDGFGGYERSLFVSSITNKIKTQHKNGNQTVVDTALDYIEAFQLDKLKKAAITGRNGVWRLRSAEQETEEVKIEGVEPFNENNEIERLNNLDVFSFDGKTIAEHVIDIAVVGEELTQNLIRKMQTDRSFSRQEMPRSIKNKMQNLVLPLLKYENDGDIQLSDEQKKIIYSISSASHKKYSETALHTLIGGGYASEDIDPSTIQRSLPLENSEINFMDEELSMTVQSMGADLSEKDGVYKFSYGDTTITGDEEYITDAIKDWIDEEPQRNLDDEQSKLTSLFKRKKLPEGFTKEIFKGELKTVLTSGYSSPAVNLYSERIPDEIEVFSVEIYKESNKEFKVEDVNGNIIGSFNDWNELKKLISTLLPESLQNTSTDPLSESDLGREAELTTPTGDIVNAKFSVVESDALTVSNNQDGKVNPAYPKELQPRDRTRKTSIMQISNIANDLKPQQLTDSGLTSQGAPIVGSDLVVESGNGRTMAIIQAYNAGKADNYKDYLVNNAQMFGLDENKIKNMDKPVLVRLRTTEVDREKFARDSNKSDLQSLSASEVAFSDSNSINDNMMDLFSPDDSGNIITPQNKAFVDAFLKELGDTGAAGLYTEDGRPTKQMVDRLQNAVFAKAYDNERLVKLVAEETDPSIRNVLTALNVAAVDFAQMQKLNSEVHSGITNSIADSAENATSDESLATEALNSLLAATEIVRNAKQSGQSVEEAISQSGLFGDNNPNAEAIALFISANNRSAKRLSFAFKNLAQSINDELIKQGSAAGDLFGGEDATLTDVITQVNNAISKEFGDSAASIEVQADDNQNSQSDVLTNRVQALIDNPPADSDDFDTQLDVLASDIEEAGLMESLEPLLIQAADKLTELLEKEGAEI
ncbi:hypothetical protein KO527_05500 [Pseudoalteromonas sp. C2R02]|uniref:defense against restriction DarA-related protein n=1 Tax=Pseudoalteromonas sp. C2R02 TaxID=2841565 RepID=UPI001C0A48FB|nr:hypothetical protein [Pseudoalteromonas sp. C2R02]MBU2968804.1 hypothetical protein [Pseudoalteromonas sp. C2R02]